MGEDLPSDVEDAADDFLYLADTENGHGAGNLTTPSVVTPANASDPLSAIAAKEEVIENLERQNQESAAMNRLQDLKAQQQQKEAELAPILKKQAEAKQAQKAIVEK